MVVSPNKTDQTVNNQVATLAGGCFWCLEAVYTQLKGVIKVCLWLFRRERPRSQLPAGVWRGDRSRRGGAGDIRRSANLFQ